MKISLIDIFIYSFLVEFQLQMSYNSILGEREYLSEQLLKSLQWSSLLFRIFCDLQNILLIQYQSSVALLSYFLRGLAKNTFITKSADIVSIWQRNTAVRSPVNSHQYTFTNSTVPNTEPIVSNSTFDDLSCGSGESLVETTLSILKILLLCFIILYLTGDHFTIHSIYHTENFLTFEPIFILYYIKFSIIN